LTRFRDALNLRVAVIGNGSGIVTVPGGAHRVYARLGDAQGDVFEAKTWLLDLVNGDVVFVRKEQMLGRGGWLVVGRLGPGDASLEVCGCALTLASQYELANWTHNAGQIVLIGNLLYAVISAESNGVDTFFAPPKLKIINVSDINNPILLSSTDLAPLDGSLKVIGTGLATNGTHAWIGLFVKGAATTYSELQVYNVATTASPAFVGRIQYIDATTNRTISQRIALMQQGGSSYGAYTVREEVAGPLNDPITVYLADSTPTVVSSILEGLGEFTEDILATKEHVFIGSGDAGIGNARHLTSVNFENLASPFIAFKSFVFGSAVQHRPIGLDQTGNYLYTARLTAASRIFNITDPDVENDHTPANALQRTMTTFGDCTYSAGGNLNPNANVLISQFDLTDPLEPLLVPTSSFNALMNVMSLASNGQAVFALGAQGFSNTPSGYAGKKTYLKIYAKS